MHYMYYADTVTSSSKILLKFQIVLLIVKAELVIGTDIFTRQTGKL